MGAFNSCRQGEQPTRLQVDRLKEVGRVSSGFTNRMSLLGDSIRLDPERADEYSDEYFIPHATSLGPQLDASLHFQQWVRIYHLLVSEDTFNPQSTFIDIPNHGLALFKDLFDVLCLLEHHPRLKNNLFIQQNWKCGLHEVSLPLRGRSHDAVRVIVDDKIPLENGRMIVLPNNCKPWMLIVQKALAKLLGTYQEIMKFPKEDLFEELTGIPLFEGSLKQAVWPQFALSSDSIEIDSKGSVFYTFELTNPSEAAFVVWQDKPDLYDFEHHIIVVLAQLYDTQKRKRVGQSKRDVLRNKTLISPNESKVFQLVPGKYCIRLYNRSPYGGYLTLVSYSKPKIDLKRRQSMEGVIKDICYDLYNQAVPRACQVTVLDCLDVLFCDDNLRGIVGLQNRKDVSRRLHINIEPSYFDLIIFELNPESKVRTITLGPNQLELVPFLRQDTVGFGRFFTIEETN